MSEGVRRLRTIRRDPAAAAITTPAIMASVNGSIEGGGVTGWRVEVPMSCERTCELDSVFVSPVGSWIFTVRVYLSAAYVDVSQVRVTFLLEFPGSRTFVAATVRVPLMSKLTDTFSSAGPLFCSWTVTVIFAPTVTGLVGLIEGFAIATS